MWGVVTCWGLPRPPQGVDNRRRLTGLHETARIDVFNSGVAHRGASIRIPRQINKGKMGRCGLVASS